MAFSPDGRTLAVGSFDGTVSLWNLTDRTQPFRLVSQINVLGLLNTSLGVWSVAFSPDGRTLATGSLDGTVILWDLTKFNHVRDHVVERVCAATRGGLDRTEWAR